MVATPTAVRAPETAVKLNVSSLSEASSVTIAVRTNKLPVASKVRLPLTYGTQAPEPLLAVGSQYSRSGP